MSRTLIAIALISLISLVAAACAKKTAESSTAAPQDAAASPAESSPAADLAGSTEMAEPDELAELARLEQALRSEGVALGDADAEAEAGATSTREERGPFRGDAPGGRTETPKASARDDDRCSRICALAESICELETRICTLADEHPGETPYADACARADRDCERASQACRACAA